MDRRPFIGAAVRRQMDHAMFDQWEDLDELLGPDENRYRDLLRPSPEERQRRAEGRHILAEIFETLINRKAARNPPRGPFAIPRQGYEAPRRIGDAAACRPVTVEVMRKRRGKIASHHAVTLEAGDWDALRSMGYAQLYVVGHGVSVHPGNRSVAKLVANAGRYEKVVYRDGDRFNLMRSNLVVIPLSLHYRATGHYPQKLMDGRMTHRLCDGRTKTKRKVWGLSPQQKLGTILYPAEPIMSVDWGPCSAYNLK